MSSLKNLFGRGLLILILLSLGLSACQPAAAPAPGLVIPTLPLSPTHPVRLTPTPAQGSTQAASSQAYKNATLPIDQRVADLLAQMTLPEKIGQMTQIENNSIKDNKLITQKFLGSVLSGGDGQPEPNTLDNWVKMVGGYQKAALQTRLGIPLIYGIDAVHGHNAVSGAVIFPHNIGLGAAGDADLVKRIGRATAEEMAATGILWNFAPVVAVVQDIRWGRTYESFGENTGLVSKLGSAYIQGLQTADLASASAVLATAKHFVGDGGTVWGSSTTGNYKIDQGNVTVDEATLRALFLPPYKAAVDGGALSVMASFSSFQGTKMHADKRLLTDLLKSELGFKGFVVSDWGGIDPISGDYSQAVSTAVNAGIDLVMVPYDATRFINTLTLAVQSGAVLKTRIDDAVSRILMVKFKMGLFERPLPDTTQFGQVGSDAHRQLGRAAVAKSQVLLKNNAQALPLSKKTALIVVAGQAADDIGIQCGGWTIGWQGRAGAVTKGATILDGIQAAASGTVLYNRFGNFKDLPSGALAEVGVVVVGEQPYAEGVGDRADLSLSAVDNDLVNKVRLVVKKLVVILVSGRPMIINDALKSADAFVAAWLPGTEGQGTADVLFGDQPFTGKLPFTWPKSMDQLPFNLSSPASGANAPLFPFGYGLTQ